MPCPHLHPLPVSCVPAKLPPEDRALGGDWRERIVITVECFLLPSVQFLQWIGEYPARVSLVRGLRRQIQESNCSMENAAVLWASDLICASVSLHVPVSYGVIVRIEWIIMSKELRVPTVVNKYESLLLLLLLSFDGEELPTYFKNND